jgi:hypothetical protein
MTVITSIVDPIKINAILRVERKNSKIRRNLSLENILLLPLRQVILML